MYNLPNNPPPFSSSKIPCKSVALFISIFYLNLKREPYGISPWHLVKWLDWQCLSVHSAVYMADVPSKISTTKQSPGSAPSTAMGPERKWIAVRSAFFTSSLARASRSGVSSRHLGWQIISLAVIVADVGTTRIWATFGSINPCRLFHRSYRHTQS